MAPQENNQNPAIGAVTNSRFLVPESMLTPGFCGAMTMLMTNTICSRIPMLGNHDAYIGLTLSALFALIVTVGAIRLWRRAVFFFLNTLIIFCTAFGASGASSVIVSDANGNIEGMLGVSVSYAQSMTLAQVTPERAAEINKEIADLLNESAQLRTSLENARSDQERNAIAARLAEINARLVSLNAELTAASPQKEPFFRQWKF